MIAQMEVLLSMWGRWAIRRAAGGIGYPSVSPMFRQASSGDAYGSQVPLGIGEPELILVDAAVGRLPEVHKLAVIQVYQIGGSLREIGARMGVDHKTVGKYLAEAQLKISLDVESQYPQNPPNSDSFDKCHRKPATA